jgi:hypothetical protein
MPRPRWRPAQLLPPVGVPRTIAFQSALYAVGSGTFLTGSIVFFNRVLGLSPLQIGTGLSIAGLTGVLAALPLGGLTDRLGGRRAWVIGAAVEGLAVACYPLVASYLEFIGLMMVIALADSLAGSGRTVYTAEVIPAEGRVRTMAFARAYLNVGFTIGSGVGAAALALDSTAALNGMVLLDAVILLLNALVVARLLPAVASQHQQVRRSPLAALRDGPYLALSALVAVLLYHAVIFTDIIPLWAITHTDTPKAVLGGLFALNTVLAVLLQVPATRGTDGLPSTVRLLRRAALASAVACPVAALAGLTQGIWTVLALAASVLLLTATELWLSAAQWFFQTDVPPAALRGSYVGMGRMISSIANTAAPAGLTLLAIQTGGWGWWVIAAGFLACAALAGPAVGWVARTDRVAADQVAA